MKNKRYYALVLAISSILFLCGCSNNSSSSDVKESDTSAQKLLSSSFDNYNKEAIRELTIAESDGSSETTYTWNEDLNAYLETGIVTDANHNMTSTARILSQEDGTNYEYYQTDALLEDGTVNERAGYVRSQDTQNDYKFCENILTLLISESVIVDKAEDDIIDDIPCKKITVSDPTNGDMTYWISTDSKLPVQLQSDTQITTYRTGESQCMTFEIPKEYNEEKS